MPGDHSAVALLSRIPHAPGLGTHGSSLCALAPSALFISALDHPSLSPQAWTVCIPSGAQLHMSAHQPWLFSPEGWFPWPSMPSMDSMHCRPCAPGAFLLFGCTCPTALAQLCPRGLFPAWQLWTSSVLANQRTCPLLSGLPWGLNPRFGGGGPYKVRPQPSGTLLEFSVHFYRAFQVGQG